MGSGSAVAIENKPTRATRAAINKAVRYLRAHGYKTARIPSSRIWRTPPGGRAPDFILLGSGDAGIIIGEIRRLRGHVPWARVLVALDTLSSKRASDAYSAGATVVAPASAFADAVRNIMAAGGRVEERARPYNAAAEPTASPRHPFEGAVVERFHDPDTGRLDAKRVAEAYGVSLSVLARGVKITQSALSKRPTAAAAQAGLRELEFVWATLLDVLGTDERVRAWLNASTRHLKDRAPIDLLTDGSAEAVANYVRSVITGEPG